MNESEGKTGGACGSTLPVSACIPGKWKLRQGGEGLGLAPRTSLGLQGL